MASERACVMCGSPRVAADAELCARCRKTYAPTPLDTLLTALGQSEAEFAEATNLPRRTVIRAATGERMSARVAARLAKVTGLPPATFRPATSKETIR